MGDASTAEESDVTFGIISRPAATFFALALTALIGGFAASAQQLRTITLQNHADVSLATSVNSANTNFMASVADCYGGKFKNSESCDCGSAAARNRLKSVYREALAAHPDWNTGETVVGYQAAPGKWVSLNFPALREILGHCD